MRNARKDEKAQEDAIEPGMTVRATEGDLGEDDVSTAKVSEVTRDEDGHVSSVVVEKGAIFKKRIEVPPERIAAVETPRPGQTEGGPGSVTIAADEREIAALGAAGTEELASASVNAPPEPADVLGRVEEEMPTVEGQRRNEGRARARRTGQHTHASDSRPGVSEQEAAAVPPGRFSWRSLGPGFLSGMAGNDASAVTAYSVNGATAGYGQLWLMLLATPLLQSVQYAAGKIGRVTQKGLGAILREQYGRRVALPTALLLIVANIALITADLVAIGTGLQLLSGIAWEWFVAPVAVVLWYLTLYQTFGTIKRIFVAMSLVFVAYLITGIISGAHWGAVLADTLIPHLGLNFVSIASAVALLGATVSPYTIYWQVHAEKEETRAGTKRQQIGATALDIAAGTISGNLIAYFIMVSTAATLFAHHQQITTAADAARALEPLLGPFAKYLFAIGLIGAGVVAIPVLLASTSYAVAEVFGWPASLWSKPWQNEGFYLILSAALLVSLGLALLRLDPIQLMFDANVLQGVLAPFLVVVLLLVGNSRRIMRSFRLGKITSAGLVVTALLMFAATALLIYGLLPGHGG